MPGIKKVVIHCLDVCASVLVYPAGYLLRKIRAFGLTKLPACRAAFDRVGVFPVRDHYYEPQFIFDGDRNRFSEKRPLPGIDWNAEEQLSLLGSLVYAGELTDLPYEKASETRYYLNNPSYGSGDAEFWYQIIRLKKPSRIFEIGSGNSTLMAREAIARNRQEGERYECRHVCIEPYEAPVLEQLGIEVIREKVEDLDVAFFADLQENDILFIDSSHVIRPAGDVLYEYLQLLPTLNPGVIVHIHDIFTPRNYPPEWIVDDVRLWNEQYLLEAFLTNNDGWRILAAVNFLKHEDYDRVRAVAPFLTPDREPASFYMQKVK